MHLRFIVDPRYVVAHAMNASQDYDVLPEWDALMDTAYRRDPQAFNLLSGAAEMILPASTRSTLPSVARRAEALLAWIIRTRVAQRVVREARAYATRVEREWAENGAWTIAQLRELTRLPMPRRTIRVFISHPSLGNGRAVDERTIVWGSEGLIPNESTVYLAHELLHQLTWDDTTEVGHAAIELLADNELRIRLNGGRYFEHPGLPELRALTRRLLPAWRTYLRTPTQDFRAFIRAHKEDAPQ